MRHGLPIIHCVDEDTRAKLLGWLRQSCIGWRKELPDEPVWSEWYPLGPIYGMKISQIIFDDFATYVKGGHKYLRLT